MPTAFTHAFVALAGGKICFARPMSWKFWGLSMACSAGPDLDAGLHAYGVQYEDLWGHRGMMHSLLFALLIAIIVVSWAFRREALWLGKRWWILLVFFFAITASHGLLDAFTNGGLGIAFLAPFDSTRYFFPWTPIEVAPLGVTRMFTHDGLQVMWSELRWVWLPATILTFAVIGVRRILCHNNRAKPTAP